MARPRRRNRVHPPIGKSICTLQAVVLSTGAFVGVVKKEPGPIIPFAGKYEHYKAKKPMVKKGAVPFIRSEDLEGVFYEIQVFDIS